MNTRNLVAIVAVIVIIIIAASAYVLLMMGPTSTTTSTTSTTSITTTSTTSTTAAVTTITMVAQNIKFNVTNPTIYLKVGQTVKFVLMNQDSDTIPHNFYIKNFPNASTSTINPGQTASFTVTFSTAGNYTYHCIVHPGLMDGNIIVQG
jgi:plastocyanin